MSRRPSRRIAGFASVAVAAACILTMIGVVALQQPMTPPEALNNGPQRAVQGADVRTPEFHPVMLTNENKPKPTVQTNPTELQLQLAGSARFDARKLHGTVEKVERPEHEGLGPVENEEEEDADHDQDADQDQDAEQDQDADQDVDQGSDSADPDAELPSTVDPDQLNETPTSNAPAPAPIANFAGLAFTPWGAGHPPDTNGDVGPTYYIQTINSSVGIYLKSTGANVAAFTLDTFMSQGSFGNICDTENFGDPVVLYDSFENRWFITDFAFQLVGGSVVPQQVLQCFAVSKTGDPVLGGWNFYSIEAPGGLADYGKFGIWSDGIYMSANMFGYAAGAPFFGTHVWALNKAQMYAGEPSAQVVDFAGPVADFTLLPGNARLQTGTPPSGTPEYFVSTWNYTNALTVYKMHVDWDKISTSTFTGPDTPINATAWPNAAVGNAPSLGGNTLDVLQIRAMAQAQYSNIGGAESLWVSHTVRRANTTGFAAPRWYQLNVSGSTVAPATLQGATWDPDGANVLHRFMPSLAVDRAGDMALGYSASSSTTKPAIDYAGRLAADAVNTLSQGEQQLIQGTGTQVGNCGASACSRWGDYSGMALDPDGCTFWMTNEYYAVDGLDHQTRIGSFKYPSCTTVGNGTLSGTVDDGTNPITGATVTLGSRSTTTDGSGNYSFTVPAGTYPSISAAKAGFGPSTATGLAVPDGGTLDKDFTLSAAATSGCFADDLQTDFQRGVPSNCDIVASGDVQLQDQTVVDQQNGTIGNSGVGITVTTYGGQTFTPSISGPITSVDINLFCSGCTGTTPNLTLSIRATSGGLPTGADLASGPITGFSDGGVATYHTATLASPLNVTAGTMYAIVIHPDVNPSLGVYALTRSGTSTAGSDVYAGGTRVSGATSGTAWSIPLTGGVTTDAAFKVRIHTGYPATGTFTSSLKDANPNANHTATWTTLSFTTAPLPANTDVKFMIAASNSSTGPWTYVGPDGTAGTYFTTSGASLSQFNGFRYLRYQAFLTSTDNTVTPTLSSVQICFLNTQNVSPTALVADPATGTAGGNVNLSATLTTGGNPVAGKSVSFSLNGTPEGNATTNASGVATLSNVSLGAIAPGSYPNGVAASWAGDSSYDPSSGTASLTVNPASGTASTTTIVSSAHPAVFSHPINFHATVSSGSGTPTGSVQFRIDGVDFGAPVALNGSGTATSATTSTLAVGVYTITAVYAGDSTYAGSTGSNFQQIIKGYARVTISSQNPAPRSSPITITVTVAPITPATATPTGVVQLFINGHKFGPVQTLSGGQTSWAITWTKQKNNFRVKAIYQATPEFRRASSGIYRQTLTP